jgi:hypothetical protein
MANVFQTVANMTSVVKDEWTSQEVAVQFYNRNPLLAMFREFAATVIGLQAQVPIQKYLPGGYVSTDAAGGNINDASPAGTAQAQYTLVYHWFQMALETGALNQTANNAQSIISSKDLEMKGSIDAVSRQCSRQLASDGTGFIAAALGSGGAQTVFQLDPAGYGYDAIARGWLYPGLKVNIGTVANAESVSADNILVDVGESPTNPTVTLTSSATQAASTFVSIANPNLPTTATNPELNGLRNIVSQTATLGGINPATAGNGYWKSPLVDTTNTVLSLDLILNLRRATRQKTGDPAGTCLLSLKQEQNLYSLLQNQVRFASDGGMSAGAQDSVTWSGMRMMAVPDLVDRDLYVINKSDFVRIVGDITEPTWVTDLEGAGGSFRWAQGKTNFVNGLVFPFQVGVQRRNSHAAATNLTA